MADLGDKLITACDDGSLERVQDLVQQLDAPIDYAEGGWSPLVKACAKNHMDVVEYLIEQGANINIVTSDGWTPLYAAVIHENHAILETLLEHGAKVRGLGKKTLCPLDKAYEQNDAKSITLIKQYNAWQINEDHSIQHFTEKADFSISRIFNFKSMTVMTIVENKTRTAVSHSEQHFSEPAVDMDLLMKAKEKLLEQDPDAIDEGHFKQSLQRPVRTQMQRVSKRPVRA